MEHIRERTVSTLLILMIKQQAEAFLWPVCGRKVEPFGGDHITLTWASPMVTAVSSIPTGTDSITRRLSGMTTETIFARQ